MFSKCEIASFIALIVFGVFLSACNDAATSGQDSQVVVVDSISINSQTLSADTISDSNERQLIIKELKRLQLVFASKRKEKIADVFTFPIPYGTMGIYIDNDTFNRQLQKNDSSITRSMFIEFYKEISESVQIDQVNKLFAHLPVEGLANSVSLEHQDLVKSEPCYRFYKLSIENNLITLTMGSNSNSQFKAKLIEEEGIMENDSSICEHALWWIFEFDGKQLQLKKILGAG
jgi:hypothetical protein